MNCKITQSPILPAGCLQLLEDTKFGSDGLCYQRLNVAEQLQRFNNPEYFAAFAGDSLIGCYVLDRRELLVENQRVSGYYRGAFAVASIWQGKGIGTQLIRKAMQWQSDSASPSISYGCIDMSNKRSLGILNKNGTIQAGLLSMYMMYRQWPRPRCELTPLANCQNDNESSLRDQVYKDCLVKDITPNKQPGFALVDEEGVAISARVSVTAFSIKTMGNAAMWATRLFVTPWSPARKRFNPSNFCYVSLSNVLIRPGCESQWSAYVSTIMAEHNVHFAALYLDTRTALFRRLRASQSLGAILHSPKGSIAIVAKVNGHEDCMKDLLTLDAPWDVWPIDA